MDSFRGWTIAQFTRAFARGDVSPVDVTQWALADAEILNRHYGTVFTHIATDEAIAAAKASEHRWSAGNTLGPLDGVPVTIKNLLGVQGWPLDFCSLTVDPASRATSDAPAVARLREAGMVLLGYTSTSEFSWKLTTDSPKYGATRNPHYLTRTPGGSSGGAAVAASAGIAPVHLGTDAAGSLRVPAAFCGVFGMKPTFGVVAAAPAGPLTHIGPLARDVGDAATVLDVLGKPDRRDWYNTPFMRNDGFSRLLGTGVDGLRVAYASKFAGMRANSEVEHLVLRGVQRLAELGAIVGERELEIVDPRKIGQIFFSNGYVGRLRGMDASMRAKLDPGMLELAQSGERQSVEDIRTAHEQRYVLGCQLSAFFQDYDLIVMPTTITPAFALGRNAPAGFGNDVTEWSGYTYPFNLAQNPAASVPCGVTSEGLPVGLQIVGPKFGDATVLAACAQLQTNS